MKTLPGIGCVNSQILRVGLSSPALTLFLVLLAHSDFAGMSHPSVRRLARICRLTKTTIEKAITELEKADVIFVYRTNRAVSVYQIKPALHWELSQTEEQFKAKSVPNGGTVKTQTVPNGGTEVIQAEETLVVRRWNDGKALEEDFWNWVASVPICGRAIHNHAVIPIHTKRRAKWLINRAWNDNAWFVTACKAIDEWYSWPWTKTADERKRTLNGLLDNFTDQSRLAEWHIEQRRQFRVVSESE